MTNLISAKLIYIQGWTEQQIIDREMEEHYRYAQQLDDEEGIIYRKDLIKKIHPVKITKNICEYAIEQIEETLI